MSIDWAQPSGLRAFGIRILGPLAAIALRVWGASWRIETDGPDPLVPDHPPIVAAFWHRNFPVAAYYYRDRKFSVAVSRSRDGDLLAALLTALGYQSPRRGSSTRGGAAVLRELYSLVKSGITVSVQTDGPQGPARVSKIGIVTLARLTQRPITPVAFSASPCMRFRSWDRALLPLPFARVACRYGEPIPVPVGSDERAEERLRVRLDAELNRLTDELDSRLGLAADLRP